MIPTDQQAVCEVCGEPAQVAVCDVKAEPAVMDADGRAWAHWTEHSRHRFCARHARRSIRYQAYEGQK